MLKPRNTAANFDRHYQPEPNSGCWLWTLGSGKKSRYGKIKWKGKTLLAHRVSYAIHVGPIPDGLTIDHTCKNTFCVNPAHMEVVTQGVNGTRSENVSTINRRKTACPEGHPYTVEGKQRVCCICINAKKRIRRAAKRKK